MSVTRRDSVQDRGGLLRGRIRPLRLVILLALCVGILVGYGYGVGFSHGFSGGVLLVLGKFAVALPFVVLFTLFLNGQVRDFSTLTYVALIYGVIATGAVLGLGALGWLGLDLKAAGSFVILKALVLAPVIGLVGKGVMWLIVRWTIPDYRVRPIPVRATGYAEVDRGSREIWRSFDEMEELFGRYSDRRASVANRHLEVVLRALGLLDGTTYSPSEQLNLLRTVTQTVMPGEIEAGCVPALVRIYNRVDLTEKTVADASRMLDQAIEQLGRIPVAGEGSGETIARFQGSLTTLKEHIESALALAGQKARP